MRRCSPRRSACSLHAAAVPPLVVVVVLVMLVLLLVLVMVAKGTRDTPALSPPYPPTHHLLEPP